MDDCLSWDNNLKNITCWIYYNEYHCTECTLKEFGGFTDEHLFDYENDIPVMPIFDHILYKENNENFCCFSCKEKIKLKSITEHIQGIIHRE